MWIGEAVQISRPPAAARSGKPSPPVRRRRVGRLYPQLCRHHRCGSTPSCTASSSTGRCAAPPNCARSAAGFAKQAEAAFSVENDWQSHGVGSALLERTLLTARNRGIAHLHMACLADNRRMQQLARKFDAELSFDFGSVVGEVECAASDAAVGGARNGVGRPGFRDRHPGRAIPTAEGNLTLTSRYRLQAYALSRPHPEEAAQPPSRRRRTGLSFETHCFAMLLRMRPHKARGVRQ